MAGRMLTRTSGGITTTFLWDSKDRIHDLIPEGQLLGFRRDGEQYSVASDALGCVRLVTDSSGDVVFRRTYGAWGETLPGGFDNVPGGMPYAFVGALGVRTDADSGMLYMRQRWYDPLLQRFISRDPIGLEGGVNRYQYAENNPSNLVDPMGLDPEDGWELDAVIDGTEYYRREDPLDPDVNEYTNQYLPPTRRKCSKKRPDKHPEVHSTNEERRKAPSPRKSKPRPKPPEKPPAIVDGPIKRKPPRPIREGPEAPPPFSQEGYDRCMTLFAALGAATLYTIGFTKILSRLAPAAAAGPEWVLASQQGMTMNPHLWNFMRFAGYAGIAHVYCQQNSTAYV